MFLINALHRKKIGVFLDWVPSHFPSDEHGLGYFDGTYLYEHADPRKGYHPDWKSLIFNYGRSEVKEFLIQNALFWLKHYHIDGLRVDAVASMLYLDYSRKSDEWIPNIYGGRENLEAITFLKELNETVYSRHPDVHMIAEESTAWPSVSKPTYLGGLGFGMKWDMGWMHDTLAYFREDPVHRKYHHDKLTFRRIYAFSENFLLSLSHDEVVYGKGSLLNKMPGDKWQKFANLRCLFASQFAQPGKKLIFMGSEFGQDQEWNHDQELNWGSLQDEHKPLREGLMRLMMDLNRIYRDEVALRETDFNNDAFGWLDHHDADQSILGFYRFHGDEFIIAVFNYTPVPRYDYRIGVPRGGHWQCLLNTDDAVYGGSGNFNFASLEAPAHPSHGHGQSLQFHLPPLAAVLMKWKGNST
jgi:1,4-alpha-glucan branching enzyme